MAAFTGWTYAAVNAIASEVANIQFRLYQVILADAGVQSALDRGISLMARSYNQTTLDQLKTLLGNLLTQEGGTNLTELTNAVDGVYSFADDRRAGLIAKTESYRAANFANLQAWQASGAVQTVKWFTAEDDNVCPQCEALDGKTVDIGADFSMPILVTETSRQCTRTADAT